jgi:hypothetical protein
MHVHPLLQTSVFFKHATVYVWVTDSLYFEARWSLLFFHLLTTNIKASDLRILYDRNAEFFPNVQ